MCRNHRTTYACHHTADTITLCPAALAPLLTHCSRFPYTAPLPTRAELGTHDVILAGDTPIALCEDCRRDEECRVWAEVIGVNVDSCPDWLKALREEAAKQKGKEMEMGKGVETARKLNRGLTVLVDPAVETCFPPIAGANVFDCASDTVSGVANARVKTASATGVTVFNDHSTLTDQPVVNAEKTSDKGSSRSLNCAYTGGLGLTVNTVRQGALGGALKGLEKPAHQVKVSKVDKKPDKASKNAHKVVEKDRRTLSRM
ncbi:uncharacterized protein BDZ99DRAFT_464642 [Mytilinidion resinicola]|uniref:Uncharacterized protein n=1 Tax=Mytilinidion resinicola TaxID=574789 RepID=A0A6A6YGK5_9PEZI|nr:uncharacterized protein BDZ99DRAFT_464642 [Mytilinidion resinicola]KAF2807729.1 hypothetical protein BDZ99DRAFT_464642 [Mytilinidion resinicola]